MEEMLRRSSTPASASRRAPSDNLAALARDPAQMEQVLLNLRQRAGREPQRRPFHRD
jgi:hypothetical protein